MNIPAGLKYTKDHEWTKVDGKKVTVGITAFAVEQLGDITLVELPKVAGKRGAAVQARIPLAVDPGFHVNSNAPNEEYLIPLKLTWKSTGALEGGPGLRGTSGSQHRRDEGIQRQHVAANSGRVSETNAN